MKRKSIRDNKIKNLFSNQKGMALLTTLIFVFILVTFGVALLAMTSNDIKLSALQRDSTKAFYLAEAGIQMAIKELDNDFDWPDGFTNGLSGLLGDGNYTVVVEGPTEDGTTIPPNHVRIISTGKVNRPEREIIVFVKEAIAEDPIFNYAIAARGRLELQNKGGAGGILTGDVYCEGIIKNGEHVDVQGTGVATIDIEEDGKEDFDDIKIGDEFWMEFPTLDMGYFQSQSNTTIIYGDLLVDGNPSYELDDQIIYVTGDVHFKDTTIIGPGVIVAEGTILIDNNSVCGINSVEHPEYPEGEDVGIFSDSEANPAIKVTPSNTDIYGYIFAPKGHIIIQTNGGVYGSVVGGGGGGPGSDDRPAEIEASEGIHWEDSSVTEYLEEIIFSIASWQEG